MSQPPAGLHPPSSQDMSGLARRLRREWLVLGVAACVALVLAFWLAGNASRTQTLAALQERLDSLAHSQADVISNIRKKYRALPFVLAQDPEFRHVLSGQSGADAVQALNHKLERLAQETGASVLYLVNEQGETLAASNWNRPENFVGQNFLFRPYVTQALKTGQAEYFALGTSSHRPGLYFSRRLEMPQAATAGVIIAKLEFLQLEEEWQRYQDALFVTDADGVVILSSRPEWLFMTDGSLPAPRRQALMSAQPFGDAPLQALPLRRQNQGGAALLLDNAETYLEDQAGIEDSRWTLHALAPTRSQLARHTTTARLTAILAIVALLALAALWLQRNQRAREHAAQQSNQRRELERLVEERTEALRHANRQLENEMKALQASRARARELREQLEQADKLSFLGQIAAGVAHEINQPVAALRMYAANSRTYVERRDPDGISRTLDAIDKLTDRIGLITSQLCHYSRKTEEESADISVREALDNALLLLAHRARRQGVELDIHGVPPNLSVRAAQVRLEQVFTNLIRNSLDALGEQPGGRIVMHACASDGVAEIHLQDNGPGISAEMRARLFMPFASGRSEGLGLGLLISHDIIHAFGGKLEERSQPGAGAHFVITLPLSLS
ncbi:hypothetical protein CBF45_09060 [Bordetella sp. J329]|uniref:sensor histidine kinase n=1 Tax=Kerstersia gyiorum TaxID=206506 RepID=UPI000FDBD001|nr:ATP-binding protein [Kerstersia gyiorum]AZV93853.1 hypothetical protein CBF45_09060 [Bordetella sp. J329]MCR4159697.1 ATP-binding protein [Kerstersia gyiorum]